MTTARFAPRLSAKWPDQTRETSEAANWLPVTRPTTKVPRPSPWWTWSGSTGKARPMTRKPIRTTAMIGSSAAATRGAVSDQEEVAGNLLPTPHPIEREQLLRPGDAAQCVPAHRHEPRAFLAVHRADERRGEQHVPLHRTAHRGDPCRLVHRRPDHREVEPVRAADVAVEHLADVQPEVDAGDRQPSRGPARVQRHDPLPHERLRRERGPARLRRI